MASDSNHSVALPTPMQIPEPPDLSRLPSKIVHSATVETLIGQNEDLMARLNVNIRRNGILEQSIIDLEDQLGEIARENSSLIGQMQIMQEKEKSLRERFSASDGQHENYRNTIQCLELKLRSADQRRMELVRFQRRIRNWVRPYLKNIKEILLANQQQVERLKKECAAKDATIGDVRGRMDEMILTCQNLERVSTKNQTTLVAKYEEQLELMQTRLEKAQSELQKYRDRAARSDDLSKKNLELSNQNVLLVRQHEDLEKSAHIANAELQVQVDENRQESKRLAIEILGNQKTIAELQTERESHRLLIDQFESLKMVWHETQKKMDLMRSQNESLSRLNQELGTMIRNSGALPKAAQEQLKAAMIVPLKSANAERPAADAVKLETLFAEIDSAINRPL